MVRASRLCWENIVVHSNDSSHDLWCPFNRIFLVSTACISDAPLMEFWWNSGSTGGSGRNHPSKQHRERINDSFKCFKIWTKLTDCGPRYYSMTAAMINVLFSSLAVQLALAFSCLLFARSTTCTKCLLIVFLVFFILLFSAFIPFVTIAR